MLIICITYTLAGCDILQAYMSGGPGEDSQAFEGASPQSEDNIAPIAIIDIYQQNSDGYNIIAGNPVYFTAEGSFDGDGDNLDYSWSISGSDISGGMNIEYVFEETGTYNIILTVSDGSLEATAEKQVEVISLNESILTAGKHSLTVEMQYTFTNEGPGDVHGLFCLMEVPKTYLPFQQVLDIRSNYSESDSLIQDGANTIAKFNLGSMKEGETKTAYINCDTVLYEYEYADIDGAGGYSFGDRDVADYTDSEYFIDSDSNIIKSAADTATVGIQDPKAKAEILYNLVVNSLEYDYSRLDGSIMEYKHASEVMQEGSGICTDYSVLYAALCRAAGIPAIVVQGIPVFSILNQSSKELPYGHAWVEIKLPGYGWVPLDVTSEENFMGYNYFLNMQTYKGSGAFYRSLEVDGNKFYPNGVYYTWQGGSEPSITWDISYRVKGLEVEDLEVYRESDFLERAGSILSEYYTAIQNADQAHGQDRVFNDPYDIEIEESLLQWIGELSISLEGLETSYDLASGKEELVSISKDITKAKAKQIECMKNADYDCYVSYDNSFRDLVGDLILQYNDMIDTYKDKY